MSYIRIYDKMMKKEAKLTCLFTLITVLSLALVPLAKAGDLVIVVNDSLADIGSLSAKEVKRIYLGQKKNLNGVLVKPFRFLEGNPVEKIFIKEVLRMRPVKLKVYWIKESLKGGAHPPMGRKNIHSLISSVKNQKGGIGYLSFDDARKSGLKIVKIK